MANRFWVGGTATWDGTAGTKWSTTSGGAGGAAVPTSADDVFFDANSGAVTVTQSGGRTCNNLDFTGFTGTFAAAGTNITVAGTTCKFVGGMTYTGAGGLIFTNTGAVTLTTAGQVFGTISMNIGMTSTGSLSLADNLNATSLGHDAGTFNAGTFNVTLSSAYNSTGGTTRVCNMGSGTWSFTGAGASFIASGTNLTLNKDTASVEFTHATPTSRTFSIGQNVALGTVTLAQTSVAYALSFSNGATLTIDNLICNSAGTLPTLTFNAANTTLALPNGLHANWFNGRGLCILANSNAAGAISIASGTRTFDKIGAYNMNFTGGATFIANNSVDLGNTTGMTFTKPHITTRQQLGM